MTAGATFKSLRYFADVLNTTTHGFSRYNIYQIGAISVSFFVDFDAVSITIDEGWDGWLAWEMVVCKASSSIARRYLRKPSLNAIWETKGLRNPYSCLASPNLLSQELHFLKPCCWSESIMGCSRYFITRAIFASVLQQNEVRKIACPLFVGF